MTTRRRFLQAGAAITTGVQEEIVISDTIGPLDSLQYRYFPFACPPA